MLAGMYVTHQGATYQVVHIGGTNPSYAYPGVSIYHLAPLDGGHLVFLHDPKAVDIPLTPACLDCEKPAGFCPGHEAERRTA